MNVSLEGWTQQEKNAATGVLYSHFYQEHGVEVKAKVVGDELQYDEEYEISSEDLLELVRENLANQQPLPEVPED